MAERTLIARAEAVANLWDLQLFTSGNAAARGRRADVMHEAIGNLRAAIAAHDTCTKPGGE